MQLLFSTFIVHRCHWYLLFVFGIIYSIAFDCVLCMPVFFPFLLLSLSLSPNSSFSSSCPILFRCSFLFLRQMCHYLCNEFGLLFSSLECCCLFLLLFALCTLRWKHIHTTLFAPTLSSFFRCCCCWCSLFYFCPSSTLIHSILGEYCVCWRCFGFCSVFPSLFLDHFSSFIMVVGFALYSIVRPKCEQHFFFVQHYFVSIFIL